MSDQKIISIEHHQTLSHQSNVPGWSDRVEVSIRLFSGALTTGWLAMLNGNEFKLLVALGLHARPLKGAELSRLIQLHLATPQDEGRLFAQVTDKALADELRMNRESIGRIGLQLKDRHLLNILELPDAGGERGQLVVAGYAGTKLYILSGELAIFSKELAPKGGVLENPAPPLDNKAGGVSENPAPPLENKAGGCRKIQQGVLENPSQIEEEDGKRRNIPPNSIFPDPAFAHFHRRAPDYVPDNKDTKALASLRREGIPDDIILAAIDGAFSRPRKPRKFAYCAAIARDLSRNSDQPQAAVPKPEADAAPAAAVAESRPTSRAGEGEADAEAGNAKLPPELAEAVTLYASLTGKSPPGNDDLNRLSAMAAGCDPVARARDSTGAAWTLRALRLAVQADDPLAYAKAVLDDWIENGPPDVRSRRVPAAKRTRNGNGTEKQKRWDELIDA